MNKGSVIKIKNWIMEDIVSDINKMNNRDEQEFIIKFLETGIKINNKNRRL